MTATTNSRIGQINAAGDVLAIFLKKFSGEVLATFDELCVMKDKVRVRTITNGKSAQFPAIGTTTAKYHVVGENLLDTANGYVPAISHAERIINIDNFLTAGVMVAELDELMNHYDIRSEYAYQLGQALANKYDRQLLQLACLGARVATPTITGQTLKVGTSELDATADDSAALLTTKLFKIAQVWDEADVPQDNRWVFLRPSQYFMLAQSTPLLSHDWNPQNGSIAKGEVYEVAGIRIVKTNHIPNAVVAADTSTNNTYSGTFTNTLFVAMQAQGLGTVKLKDLTLESEYKMEFLSDFILAKYALGHGILRPECCYEVKSA